MSITIRATPELQEHDVPPAQISADQFAAFSRFAFDNDIIAGRCCEGEALPQDLDFEANIGRFALARLARIFDFEVGVIAVLDEAQFRRRRVCIFSSQPNGETMMTVSPHADRSVEFCETARLGLAGLRTSDLMPTRTNEVR